ncbi:MAG: NERD domain-containing protein [Chitinophagaceae bacterium]|nr:NERD domain-containing protein [Anaerolineae bacterium]
MKVVSPARPLVRRSRNMLVMAGVIVAAGAFLALVGVALFVFPWTAPESSGYATYLFARNSAFILGILVAIVGAGVIIRALTLRTENTDAVQTAKELSRYLDDRFTFFTNVNKRGLGYIDGVLVGPAGALVFRILGHKGLYFNEAAGWLKGGANGVPLRPNPTQQAVDDIKNLREFLTANQLERVPVFGVIVFIYPEPVVRLQVKDPVVPPTHLTALLTRLQADYLAKERIDTSTVTMLNKLLQTK